jgi:MFS family permease
LNLAYGVLAGFGFGTAATHVVSTIVSHNFTERLGLAVGIATAGATGGQLVVIPLLARVLDYTDWRTCYVAIGFTVLALTPLVFLLIRPRAGDDAARAARRAVAEPLAKRLRLLMRSPTFHLLFLFWSYFI